MNPYCLGRGTSHLLLSVSALVLAGCTSPAPREWRSAPVLQSVPEHLPHGTLILRKNSPWLYVLVDGCAAFREHGRRSPASDVDVAEYRLTPGEHTIRARYGLSGCNSSSSYTMVYSVASDWLTTTLVVESGQVRTLSALALMGDWVCPLLPQVVGTMSGDCGEILVYEGALPVEQILRRAAIERFIRQGWIIKTECVEGTPIVWLKTPTPLCDTECVLDLVYRYWREEMPHLRAQEETPLLIMQSGGESAEYRCVGGYAPSGGLRWSTD